MKYDPSRFDIRNQAEAKSIILTPDSDRSTEQRWRVETPYVAGLCEKMELDSSSVVLDYGCGIGRLSKALIEQYGCFVVGVDISQNMRALAVDYVQSDRFLVCHPNMLAFVNIRCDAAIAVWVLQHCPNLDRDVANIRGALAGGDRLFVLNEKHRCIPVDGGWSDDGKSVNDALDKTFALDTMNRADPAIVGEAHAQSAYWALYTAK